MYPGKTNFLSHSIRREPPGTPLWLRLATLSILSPLITTTAFSTSFPSDGLITVPPTSEIFSASALLTTRNAKRNAAIRFMAQEYHGPPRFGEFDSLPAPVVRNRSPEV